MVRISRMVQRSRVLRSFRRPAQFLDCYERLFRTRHFVAASVLVATLAGCGGRAAEGQETDAEADGRYDALETRAREASGALCQNALTCYGRPEDEATRCFVPTSDGGYRAFASGPACDPE